MSEIHGKGMHKLQQQITLQEVLETAIEFERTAWEFYAALAARVSKPLRSLVDELAQEEKQHYELFKQLLEDPDVLEQIEEKIVTPVSNGAFSDCILLPDLGENPDDQAILQYALGREHTAMLQYSELAYSAPEGELKATFQYLAYEETQHKNELEKRYYEIVHSGGV